MKPVNLALVFVLAAGVAACQQSGPAPGTAAATPAPATATAAPSASAPAEAAAGTPATTPGAAVVPAAAPAGTAAAPAGPPEPPPAASAVAANPAVPPASAPAAVPAPEPTPTPTPAPFVIAAGTMLSVRLEQAVTSKTAQPEDPVQGVLAEDVSVRGRVVLPAGSEVTGHVVSALRSGRVKGKAQLVVAFGKVRAGGRTYAITADRVDVVAGSSKGKDAKIAGGAAAAGTIIGAIAGGGDGALKGGLIGGAAGGAAVLATRGVEAEIKAGSVLPLKLAKPLTIPR